ncbi:UDP-glucose 4-epimerase GalE [Paracoccus sp. MBLB3053]|uniref:UDP-glucose 4-epimerase n=1 Tax=Paracoccus aurantius TaxID=3073814 RepID=A0ABU2HYB2_9RHOB|nr:UDP-glucose 4-epimerase GalE [Paracoccus sp. MBLB3053]MDS9470052.1 UDP-glucose 4-epimerase GalE [Paracoccus sp. MBLB3053]
MIAGQASRRAFISGVAGYIGSHAALCFLDAGWQVIGIDDLSTGHVGCVPMGVVFHQSGVSDPETAALLAQSPPDVVLHFAAKTSIDESIAAPGSYYETNTGQAARFFEAAARAGVANIVHSSTAAVYGEAGDQPVDEGFRLRPASPYGRSKLAAEWALSDTCRATGMRHVILRYFNVAGADPLCRSGPRGGAQHLIKVVAEAAVGLRDRVRINGTDYATPDGTAIRDYVHVSDLVRAHLSAAEYLLAGGGSVTLNCGCGRGYSVREVIDATLALDLHRFAVTDAARRPGDVARIVANSSRMMDLLNWTPSHDRLETILETSVAWEQAMLNRARAAS